MSRKGHYNGGGTLVGRQNASWFTVRSIRQSIGRRVPCPINRSWDRGFCYTSDKIQMFSMTLTGHPFAKAIV
jgi:hypothetical protein